MGILPFLNSRFFSSRINLLRWVALLLVAAWLTPSGALAQQGQTSMGTDFWVGFMPNYIYNANNVRLFIASGTDNEVWVAAYCGSKIPPDLYHTTMTPNSVWTVDARSVDNWETHITEQPQYKAIHVYSKNPIALYGISNESLTTDSYLALPTDGLGTDYYPSCYFDDKYTLGSPGVLAGEFLIIAPYDNTVVTIGPVKTPTRAATPTPLNPDGQTVLHQRGATWSVTLMQGQTYLVQSTGLNYGDDDITGTHIVSSKPVGLISGHVRASIPIGELAASNGSKDHLSEMIPSVDKWGTQYYDMPMAGRTICGDMVRVIAGEDGETITATSTSGSVSAVLNHAGDFYDFEQVLDPTVFSSSNGKKFLAVQHAYSQNYMGDPGQSDPFSIVLTPQEQFQKKLIFRTPKNEAGAGYDNYATFICQEDSILKIKINNLPISAFGYVGQLPIAGTNPQMAARRILLPGSDETFVATCGAPFGCYLYGFSQFDGYGHPAGMALGTISPDTLPPLQKVDTLCGNYQVEYLELRHKPQFSFEDTKISDIAMITDTLDARWPRPSHNFAFNYDPSHPFTSGDSTAYFDLTVINPAQDAYAAVWTTDKAGNDTVYQYSYTAPKLKPTPLPFKIGPVRVTDDSCEHIAFINTGDGPIVVANANIMGIDTAGTFTVSPTEINRTIQPGDSVSLQLCFTPSDTLLSYDTLTLELGQDSCTRLKYPVAGTGVTPLIIASDLNFGNVTVGDTFCKPVTVRNVGKAPLTLDAGTGLGGNADFSFSDSSLLPITVQPGSTVTLEFCFHPQDTGAAQVLGNWRNNLPGWFVHSIKDTSLLLGVGVQAGLNWDRPEQGFTTECSNPVIDTVYLMNPSSGNEGSDILVDSIAITGPDASEFSIVATQFGGNPRPWLLKKDASAFVILQFTPDLSKGYVNRTAQITAYGGGTTGGKTFNPVLKLTGTVRHATIRITPQTYDFGTVRPGDVVETNFWIHNDGDTTLVLLNLGINGGFTDSGFTSGEQIPPGDSLMVTVMNSNVPPGTSFGNLTLSAEDPACTSPDTAIVKVIATSFAVASTGHDFGDMYVCQTGSATVSATDSGSIDAILLSAQILDTASSSGAAQYSFANGSQRLTIDTMLHSGQSGYYTVNFSPEITGGGSAYVLYTWVNASTGDTSHTLSLLLGTPLHYVNTLSVASGANNGVYSAYPAQGVTVPVTIVPSAGGLNLQSGIYQVQFIFRYKRDMFIPNPAVGDNGLTVIRSDTATDPVDASYVLDTIVVASASPITQADTTIAHINLEYVVNKDSISSLNIMNPVYMNATGQPVCWVSHDTIPAVFAGLDRCGDLTLRNLLSGEMPSFKIQTITPNPVSGDASIGYSVRLDGVPLTMEVYDELGQKELILMQDSPVLSGQHSVPLETEALPAGSYVLRVSDGTTVQSMPFVVQK